MARRWNEMVLMCDTYADNVHDPSCHVQTLRMEANVHVCVCDTSSITEFLDQNMGTRRREKDPRCAYSTSFFPWSIYATIAVRYHLSLSSSALFKLSCLLLVTQDFLTERVCNQCTCSIMKRMRPQKMTNFMTWRRIQYLRMVGDRG